MPQAHFERSCHFNLPQNHKIGSLQENYGKCKPCYPSLLKPVKKHQTRRGFAKGSLKVEDNPVKGYRLFSPWKQPFFLNYFPLEANTFNSKQIIMFISLLDNKGMCRITLIYFLLWTQQGETLKNQWSFTNKMATLTLLKWSCFQNETNPLRDRDVCKWNNNLPNMY